MIRILRCALVAALLGGFTSSAPASFIAGPDAYGYVAESIPYNLRNVRIRSSNPNLDNSDDQVAIVPIGFSFNFYGNDYTEVGISTNGFLSFDLTGNSGCCSGQPIPSPFGINNLIAGWWTDLNPNFGGIIRSQLAGEAGTRQFIVGFYDVSDYSHPFDSINTMEIILHEGTNHIELQYHQIQYDTSGSKTAGIENANGTIGLQLTHIATAIPGVSDGDLVFETEGYLIRQLVAEVPEPSGAALAASLLALMGAMRPRQRERRHPA